jgi:hypothetical protein
MLAKERMCLQPKKIGAKQGRKPSGEGQTQKSQRQTDRRKRFERKLCEKSKKIGGHTSHIARGVEQERSEQTSVDIIALITLIQQEDPSFTIEEI